MAARSFLWPLARFVRSTRAVIPVETADGRRRRIAWTACFVLAGVHVLAFLTVALLRVRYPYDLEWMEGGQLLHSYELLAGRPIYRAPSAEYIAFPYQPLYSAVVAALGALFGLSMSVARTVSIVATLACALLVGSVVRHETGSRALGVLAGATLIALYRVTGFWFDLARVDTLFLALLIGGLHAARTIDRPWRACVVSVLLLLLAYKTKQFALPFFVLVPPLLWVRSRGAAVIFAVIACVALVVDSVLEQRVSGGWFSFFVNDVPRGQPYQVARLALLAPLMVSQLPVIAVFALTAGRLALRPGPWGSRLRQTWVLATLLGFVATVAAWARPGGAANNLMTTYFFAIVPAFVGLHRLETAYPDRPHVRWLGLSALALQLAWLGYDPVAQVPRAEDYAAGLSIVETLRATPGPVLVPERPWLAVLAGKEPSYQANAYWELGYLKRTDWVPQDLTKRLATGYYAVVLTSLDPRAQRSFWWPGELAANYRCDRSLDLPGRGLAAFTGMPNGGPKMLCEYAPQGPPRHRFHP